MDRLIATDTFLFEGFRLGRRGAGSSGWTNAAVSGSGPLGGKLYPNGCRAGLPLRLSSTTVPGHTAAMNSSFETKSPARSR
jgi:hypothetical protein